MNANGLAKLYDRLTPEERFRLILAAGARGDEAERDRLVNAGRRAHDAEGIREDEPEQGDEAEQTEAEGAGAEEPENEEQTAAEQLFDLALAQGFMLKMKADGWKLFCRRMSVPAFAGWEGLPGFDRIQRALAIAEKAAFVPEGMLRWLNAVRPDGEPELTAIPVTVEGMADAAAKMFLVSLPRLRRVQSWNKLRQLSRTESADK